MPSADDETLGAVDKPLPPPMAATSRPQAEDPNLGRRIGPYRLESLLGRGGMGVIYLAVREDDFEQRVALKLVGPGLRTAEVLRRFYKERQILAHLEHPSIARIFDGGTTDDALPYFVMEYVDGRQIDRYCKEHELPLRQRLELFRKVCSVVHFAHQNLVVHRDLKPGNILVTPDGVPKLLDFGIAKILHAEANALETQSGKRPMTPDYASPEQLLGRPITTAGDVYSLGVLLYRLVADRPPYCFEGCGPARMAEIICREEPVPPSLAAGRRQLAGDVDAIVLKAMRKEPHERYASALRLADDVERHLTDLPVRARSGGSIYRAGKLARRHKLGFATALLVVGLAVTSTVLWRQAEHQRAHAAAAQLRSEKVADFLENLFAAADPDAARGGSLSVREVLDRGREQLARELRDEPEIRAELLAKLGTVYNNLALYDEARKLKQEALRTRRAANPADSTDLASDLNNLARLLYDQGDYAGAETHFRDALAMWRRLGHDARSTTTLLNVAASVMHQGRYVEALELHHEALELQRGAHGPDAPEVAASLYSLGALYRLRGEPGEAEPLLREALEIFSRSLGRRHSRVAAVLGSLGRALHDLRRYDEARPLYEEALDIRLRLFGDGHVQVAYSRKNMADLLLDQGEVRAAGELLEPALATLRRAKPAGDWTLAGAECVWGSYLVALGRYPEAEAVLLQSYRTLREVKGDRDAATRDAHRRVAALYEAWGRGEEAARYRAAAHSEP